MAPTYPDPLAEPEGGWATQPQPIGGPLAELLARLQRTRELSRQRRADNPARWDPDYATDPEANLSPAAKRHQAWSRIVGPANATWRLGNVTHHVVDRVALVADWLEGKRPKPLLLTGPAGSGKTALACAAAFAWWKGGAYPVVFVPVSELLVRNPTGDDPSWQHRRRMANADERMLVVLDDLSSAAQPWTSFTEAVDQLARSQCRVITTTNLRPSELRDATLVDDRVQSRLGSGLVVPVDGPDLRPVGQVPDPPDLTPCPYPCADGMLTAEDHPDGYEHAERYAAEHGYARLNDAQGSREFDALMRGLALPCPHCSR